MDGVGEWATTSGWLEKVTTLRHSGDSLPALDRSPVFRVHILRGLQGEFGRVQTDGSRAVGTPHYVDLIREQLIDIKDDGSFRLNLDYFDYCTGLDDDESPVRGLFGGPPRVPRLR